MVTVITRAAGAAIERSDTTSRAAAIEATCLMKSFRVGKGTAVAALKGVSLRVPKGTIFGLLGENGAGKTTLVKILLGLTRTDAGEVTILGGSPSDAGIRRRVGYLPEHMALPPYLTGERFVRDMGSLQGMDRATLRRRVPEMLELVGLEAGARLIGGYSKGMRQRVGLAQALVNDPELLFLDEPTEGLDPRARRQFRDLLVSLKERGKTIFLNSHQLSEVELVCDQVLILNRGSAARVASPGELARATGEYRLTISEATARAAEVVAEHMGTGCWDEASIVIHPRDLAHLNALIDALRAVPVEIQAVEPVRSTLEQSFFRVVEEAQP